MENETIIEKLVLNKKVDIDDIYRELYEICERTHSSCDSSCPVYRLNGGKSPNRLNNGYGCDVFKNGLKMAKFIKEPKGEPLTGEQLSEMWIRDRDDKDITWVDWYKEVCDWYDLKELQLSDMMMAIGRKK